MRPHNRIIIRYRCPTLFHILSACRPPACPTCRPCRPRGWPIHIRSTRRRSSPNRRTRPLSRHKLNRHSSANSSRRKSKVPPLPSLNRLIRLRSSNRIHNVSRKSRCTNISCRHKHNSRLQHINVSPNHILINICRNKVVSRRTATSSVLCMTHLPIIPYRTLRITMLINTPLNRNRTLRTTPTRTCILARPYHRININHNLHLCRNQCRTVCRLEFLRNCMVSHIQRFLLRRRQDSKHSHRPKGPLLRNT